MNNPDLFLNFTLLLALALAGGMIAHRLRQPIMLGYMLIGIAVGPHALRLITDTNLIESTASIGVALLMFTLGLEISISQLKEVGKVGIWGGIIQIAATSLLGLAAGVFVFQWPLMQSVLFGLIISLSSTAVCLKLLMDRGELSSTHGRIMMAMLILQDIAVVFMTVVIPLMASKPGNLPLELATATGKTFLIVGSAIILGRWILPWLLGSVGGVRARELFLLTILVLSLGAAIATQTFGFSIVFGAFLVGLVLRETNFMHQALAEITPLRDVFATLFFVSLGMLLNLDILINNLGLIALLVAGIVVLKSAVVFAVVRLFGYGNRIALLTGGGIFQTGEFGFILAQTGLTMGMVSAQFHSVMLASIIVTIILTPVSISLISRLHPALARSTASKAISRSEATPAEKSAISNTVVIAGYGRVGQSIAQAMENAGIPCLVIDIDPERLHEVTKNNRQGIYGDATNFHVLSQAGLKEAKALVITYPDPMAVVTTARLARSINPGIHILARVHRPREIEELKSMGVTELISPEYEASFRFIKRLLNIVGADRDARRRLLAMARDTKEMRNLNLDD